MHSAEAAHHASVLPDNFYLGVLILSAILIFFLISEIFEDHSDE